MTPVIGELSSKRKPSGGLVYHIWAACQQCGQYRWVTASRGKPLQPYCRKCSSLIYPRPRGIRHPSFKNGRYSTGGYIVVTIEPEDDFYLPMAKQGHHYCVLEHRLVMAKHLRRNLQTWELVHHKNGIKTDNRIDNLELTTNGAHSISHTKGYRDGYLKGLRDGKDQQISRLKAENADLIDRIMRGIQ